VSAQFGIDGLDLRLDRVRRPAPLIGNLLDIESARQPRQERHLGSRQAVVTGTVEPVLKKTVDARQGNELFQSAIVVHAAVAGGEGRDQRLAARNARHRNPIPEARRP